ncbi:MAG: hypothetical protein KAS32_08405 [Candidatus Peribacteraceae bacterium]|nr:hypothetical protein [Candidatus Peribacteraceae bacterium]
MKKVLLITVAVFLLISLNTGAEEFKVLEISDNELDCQIINSDLDCQLIDNQISVLIRSGIKDMESDLDLKCGRSYVDVYPYKCNRTENLYTCHFDVDPLINLTRMDSVSCEMVFYFYTKFSNESMGSERYDGDLRIVPLVENTMLSIEKQKNKLKNDFSAVKYFAKESAYNVGICSYLGSGVNFGELIEYESMLATLGGTLIPAETISGRSLNLLKASSIMASAYVESGDLLLPILLDNFIYQGILTGGSVNEIIQRISQGYTLGQMFHKVKSGVDESCDKIENDFEHILNPNFLIAQKFRLLDCLEKRDFKNCWKKLEEMQDYVNPGNTPKRSEIRFYSDDYLLRDNSNICGDGEIRIAHENIGRFGIDYITVKSPGCENVVYLEGLGGDTYSFSDFLCAESDPVDGLKYKIEVDPGVLGEMVTYNLNYYEDSENCNIQQGVILV